MMRLPLLALALFLVSAQAFAVGGPVTQVRRIYSSSNVTTTTWAQIVASLPDVVSTIEIFDSSAQTLEIGVGPVGSEVVYLIVFPGGNGPVRLNIRPGASVSIKALSANATAGELDVNFYN